MNEQTDFNPLDGGWLENPISDFTSENINKNIGLFQFEENQTVQPFTTDNPDALFFSDSYRADNTGAITINDVYEMEKSLAETFEPDGCKNLKIASLMIAFLVVLLFIFVIVTAFLNTNDVQCTTRNVYCPPCPVCPSSVDTIEIMSGENSLNFYLRDRINFHSIFNVVNNYVSTIQGSQGSLFSYDSSTHLIRVQPSNNYLYAFSDGGYLMMSQSPYQELPKECSNKFNVNNEQIELVVEEENLNFVCVESNGKIYLHTADSVSYKNTPYSHKVKMFKNNPNLTVSFQ